MTIDGPEPTDPWDELSGEFISPDGEPMTLRQWADAYENPAVRIIRRTQLWHVRVSTVWLGINHNWSGVGPPLIFETMIFGGRHDDRQWRASTRAEALAQHDHAVWLASSLLRRWWLSL